MGFSSTFVGLSVVNGRAHPWFRPGQIDLALAGSPALSGWTRAEPGTTDTMANRPRRPSDPFAAAEAAFRSATTKPAAEAAPKAPAVPYAKEAVTLRIDRDVLEHFQEDGPGWQDRINTALRRAAGL